MKKTAFLFPGQGAQFVGMGQTLLAELPAASERFDQAQAILGYDLRQVCLEGPAERLNSTTYSQPALFVCSLAAVDLLRRDNPQALAATEATAGLSLGEYTALTFAEAIDFEAALRVVQCRGEAMQAAADQSPSGMVSVLGLETRQVEELCDQARQPDEVLQIANYLCPGNLVVSGHSAACERLGGLATAAGAMKVIPLAVAGAFHTSLMAPALERLRDALRDTEIRRPRMAVISNVDAQPHWDPEEIRDILVRQVVSPVRWEDCVRHLLASGTESFYELGPGKVLKGLMKRIDRKAECENLG